MVDFILHYKWYFFLAGEIIFWGSLIGFLLLRYGFNLPQLSKYAIIIWLFSDLWLLTIGIMDYLHTGIIDTFQIVIIIFLIYAFTMGRSDFRKLDQFVQRKIAQWKGQELPIKDEHPKKTGLAHAKKEARGLGLHALVFFLAMVIFAFLFELRPLHHFPLDESIGSLVGDIIEYGFFDHPTAGRISGIWTLILVIDTIYSLSYFAFPKKSS